MEKMFWDGKPRTSWGCKATGPKTSDGLVTEEMAIKKAYEANIKSLKALEEIYGSVIDFVE